ncbi:late competence protein ComER [Cohnella faecalis]|uniref:Pyrroline-5-carboxylate reductase n=1 Tax=Cohnella faecalis TaxID=2315694 RepID=A0A398CZ08_9BACL|nr:late competence protein ComER [Cohnella faecalis]RIE04164.1 late competence protein ComER [Cohnella faecalis]
MKIGFIGAGSMGSLLMEAFIATGAIQPDNIVASSRTPSKTAKLAEKFPGLAALPSNSDTADASDLLFLCVKPMDFRAVLEEIAPVMSPEQLVVSITSPVTLSQLEQVLPCKIAKIIPSVVNSAYCGASLFMWGSRLAPGDRTLLWDLFSHISRPVEIAEEEVRAASDLSACGPAFISYLLEEFIEAAVTTAGINREKATELAGEMLLGTARMLVEQRYSTAQLQAKVSVPGGITAAALEKLKARTTGAFADVFRTTHEKYAEDLSKVDASLASAIEAAGNDDN